MNPKIGPWARRFSRKIIKREAKNLLDQAKDLNYKDGAVSLLREASKAHTIILVQGINSMGQGFFIKYHLVKDDDHQGKAKVIRKQNDPFHPNNDGTYITSTWLHLFSNKVVKHQVL